MEQPRDPRRLAKAVARSNANSEKLAKIKRAAEASYAAGQSKAWADAADAAGSVSLACEALGISRARYYQVVGK